MQTVSASGFTGPRHFLEKSVEKLGPYVEMGVEQSCCVKREDKHDDGVTKTVSRNARNVWYPFTCHTSDDIAVSLACSHGGSRE